MYLCGYTELMVFNFFSFEFVICIFQEFWRFSDMTCSAYPLTALDTIRPDGSTSLHFTISHLIKFVVHIFIDFDKFFCEKNNNK